MTKLEKTGRIIGVLEIFTAGIWTISFILIILGLLIGQGLPLVEFLVFIFSYLFFSVLLVVIGVISIVTRKSTASVAAIILLSITIIEHAAIIDHAARLFNKYSAIELSISILAIVLATVSIILTAFCLSEPKKTLLNTRDYAL